MASIITITAIVTAATVAGIVADVKALKKESEKLTAAYIQAEGDRKFKEMLNKWRAENGLKPVE